ncbi:delta-1-pyrroline-5-carboxylate dehydrogenase [Amanita muscaria]
MSTAHLAHFKVPDIDNEPLKNYAPGSPERAALQAAIVQIQQELPFEVPCVIDGKPVKTGTLAKQPLPHDHARHLCVYHEASPSHIDAAVSSCLKYKSTWESTPWADRASIFLKAADLISTKYRYKLIAATMLGQGKNAWQGEIDAAAELIDFFRFNVKFVEDLYSQQPPRNTAGCWNRSEYRPLEGFVFAVSPFNFSAIGGNLVGVPALVGNVVVWKPSPGAIYSNYIIHQILLEAGLPPSVIQFVPGPAVETVQHVLSYPDFAALHFTGSTFVFKKLWQDVAQNLDKYKTFPRIVGETGGKNFHVIHPSANVRNAVLQTVRAAFEYQGQKCSACSRLYVPQSLWSAPGEFRDQLLDEVKRIKVGVPTEWDIFMGPVISSFAYDKITGYFAKAKSEGGEILIGGTGDNSKGYFVNPTVILTKDPKSVTMREEIFGPVLTVYVYPDEEFEKTLDLVDSTGVYALTGSIFSTDRQALLTASSRLRHAAGNVYYNDKCTGAVVGQQPFGGARASGTNDKAGSANIFSRFVSVRSIKDTFVGLENGFEYPSNLL